jgi:hypothetical protein
MNLFKKKEIVKERQWLFSEVRDLSDLTWIVSQMNRGKTWVNIPEDKQHMFKEIVDA